MKRILLLLSVTIFTFAAEAKETLAYLYIQGDKQTPFYVKLENEMQPRYGKNYSIIPQLAPGPVHIEILFQQNAYPAHKFTVLIPDGGSRGFLLVRKDSTFSLYDLQQDFYLSAGNNEEDDRLPTFTANTVARDREEPVVQKPDISTRQKAEVPTTKPAKVKTKTVKVKARPEVEKEPLVKDGSPAFIPDLELSGKEGALNEHTENTGVGRTIGTPVPAILNSDCPTAMTSAEFGKVFNTMSASATDEERLEYMQGKMDGCYETWQARALAQMLSGDAARYSLLKKIYPRISDQGSFSLLDDLLTTDIWKAEFARLVHR
jgi:hypothetical protein